MSDQPYELSVIVPTYNERENIPPLIAEVEEVFRRSGIRGEIVVVDDNSPDGTADAARALNDTYGNIQVLVRTANRGLSPAIVDGFAAARSDYLLTMDADLSHPPEVIPELYAPLREGKAQLVIGCRYMKGGGISDWTWKRRIISKGASILARSITRILDPMSGLFALHRSVIAGVKLNPKGFKIGLEIVARGRYQTILEIPYFFRDRRFGESKLDGAVMKEYLQHLCMLAFAPNSLFSEFLRFSLVGLTGLLLNLAVLHALVEWFPFWPRLGAFFSRYHVLAAAAVAFAVAVSSNFLLNHFWTFRRRARSSVKTSYALFVLVSLGGLLLNLLLLHLLHYRFGMWYMSAQVIAVCLASLWNYLGSKIWAFRAW